MPPKTKPNADRTETDAIGDGKRAFFTPNHIAQRWSFHPESVRRLLRKGQIESIIIGGRRLVPVAEIERIEAESRIVRNR